MNFKSGMNILPSFYYMYTHCEMRAPPISGVGWASECIDRVRKLLFYAALWWLTTRDRRLAVAFSIRAVK